MARPAARHEFADHTGELRLHLEAPGLAALFEQAGLALAELMLERAATETVEPPIRVELSAVDSAALLAAWLNELIFLSETEKLVFTQLRIDCVADTHLSGEVAGVRPEALRTAVKAATLHELSVRRLEDGYTADVVLDV